MRRVLGVCLVLSCLLVSLPASASTGATWAASFTELVSQWLISAVMSTTKDGDTPGGDLELGSTWDPNG